MATKQAASWRRIRRILLLIFNLVIILFFSACEPRERINVFDPLADIDSLDLGLAITSADSIIGLRWHAPPTVDYTGFHIYRKVGTGTEYRRIASLPAGQTVYEDTVTDFDVLYRYYVTVQGQSGESPPSYSEKVTPGPLSFWVLDNWLYITLHLTYDLQHTLVTRYGVWQPQSMALDRTRHRALITYPAFQYFEVIDTRNAAGLAYNYELDYPYETVYIEPIGQFWLCDSSGGVFRVATTNGLARLISDEPRKPVQMVTDADFVYILDKGTKSIQMFNLQGDFVGRISKLDTIPLNNPQFIEAAAQNNVLLIIDMNKDGKTLYRYSVNNDSVQLLFSSDGLQTVREAKSGAYLWLSVNNEQGAELVQLSTQGLRLNSLNRFKYIRDFRINTFNGALLVADTGYRELVHIRPDGTVIGRYPQTIYPLRVYIQ